jgi:hypothetical protein
VFGDFLTGAATLAVLMIGWLGLQAWVRSRADGPGAACDALEGRFGCYGCIIRGRCQYESDADQSPTPMS